MTEAEARTAAQLAIGRVLRMGARPTQPGDIEEYERCVQILKETSVVLKKAGVLR